MNEGEILPVNQRQAQVFDTLYTVLPRSPTFRDICRTTWKDEYPEELEASGYLTWTDLRTIVRQLRVAQGQMLLDVACGCGGVGLWIARETGAFLVGFDLSSVAIASARERARRMGLGQRTTFLVADVMATDLLPAHFDGAICVDAFTNFHDKKAAATEIARLLRPQACFVFIAYDYAEPSQVAESAPFIPQVSDHHQLLQDAGFVVETYEAIPNWSHFYQTFYEHILAHQEALIVEMGDVIGKAFVRAAQRELANLHQLQRSIVVAHKP
jgi:ubiquinone/menaquinone biosynthesis C-methylase UbiE